MRIFQPNGRFEVGKKICLSISGHHPETWQPSWSIRTALLAIIAFMPTPGQGTIGSLDYSPEERRVLARRSRAWACPLCGNTAGALLEPTEVTFHPNTSVITSLVHSHWSRFNEARLSLVESFILGAFCLLLAGSL